MNEKTKYFECSEGDSNDCFSRFILKGTDNQVDQYIKSMVTDKGYKESEIEEIGGDPWGYGVMVTNEDISDYEYFVDCTYLDESEIEEIESYSIEEYNKKFFYHKIIDLGDQ